MWHKGNNICDFPEVFLKGHPFLLPAIWNTSLKPTSPAAILYHIKPTIQEGMLYFFCSFKKLPLSPDSLHPSSVDTHTAIKTSWPWLESGKEGGHGRGQWQRQRCKAKVSLGGGPSAASLQAEKWTPPRWAAKPEVQVALSQTILRPLKLLSNHTSLALLKRLQPGLIKLFTPGFYTWKKHIFWNIEGRTDSLQKSLHSIR